MAIRTVNWNPSYFAAPFNRPRRRFFLAKTALCCMSMCDLAAGFGRRKLRSRRPQFGWASKPRTANGKLRRISEPLQLLVAVSKRLALLGFIFAETAECCIGVYNPSGVGRIKWPFGRPRFAWPSKPRTAHGDLDRSPEPLLLLGSVLSSLAPCGGFERRKKNGYVLYGRV